MKLVWDRLTMVAAVVLIFIVVTGDAMNPLPFTIRMWAHLLGWSP